MAGRSYFFSIFTVVSLTAGLLFAVDAQAFVGLLAGILRIVFILLAAVALIGSIALFFGPEEQ